MAFVALIPDGQEGLRSAAVISQKKGADPRRPAPASVRISEQIVDSPAFIIVTTVLTAYALVGDDIRLITTDQSADPAFNVMVLLCLVVFTFEIVVSCLGRADYFLGFFFWLDVFSTASLLLDLTWVADMIAQQVEQQNNDDNATNLRSGRTARLGARAGRVVRVLRLVRILKLYKNWKQAAKRRNSRITSETCRQPPGAEEDWDESDIEMHKQRQESLPAGESRVGKRLSEITTRRVVGLILTMLLILPNLQSGAVDQTARSSHYGADDVFMAFQANEGGYGTRQAYEEAMLRYIYYHNWFARADPRSYCRLSGSSSRAGNSCSDAYYGHLFWIGIRGHDAGMVQSKTLAAALSEPTVSAWTARTARPQDGIYNYGTMPPQVQALLHSTWNQRCDTAAHARRGLSLLGIQIEGIVDTTAHCPEDLRNLETLAVAPRLVAPSQHDSWHFIFYFDIRPYVRMDAMYNLLVTLFVLILLILGSMMFASDANTLILRPVEKMVERVEAIRDDPLIAMQMADDEYKCEEVAKALSKRDRQRAMKFVQDLLTCSLCDVAGNQPLETVILEKTIIKLGSLLALGFGEAGANIIAHNMRGHHSAGINAMIPGTRRSTIIGVARVRDFIVTTEVLQAKINAFCNQIAEIVHGVCNEFHGAPNKNNGDTFLVIWRLDGSEPSDHNARMAEMSVVAFATILGALHQSPLLADFRSHPVMQNRLGRNCRVNLSFGLHAGWAIEGAVGSEFKIDASYLSPNVSVATSIERATESYGISLMVGQSVIELGTSMLASKCRLIDKVSITGLSAPTELYSVDLDYTCIKIDNSRPPRVSWNTRQRFKVRQYMDTEKRSMLNLERNVLAEFFDADPVILTMRSRYTVEFHQLYDMGYQNYSQGEWHVARRMLYVTRSLLGIEDGPSSSLLRFMKVYDYEAPKSWQGVRVMDSDQIWQSNLPHRASEGGGSCSLGRTLTASTIPIVHRAGGASRAQLLSCKVGTGCSSAGFSSVYR